MVGCGSCVVGNGKGVKKEWREAGPKGLKGNLEPVLSWPFGSWQENWQETGGRGGRGRTGWDGHNGHSA